MLTEVTCNLWINYDVTHVSRSPNDVTIVFVFSNRVFTEGTCKLLNLVISDLVDEDYVIHDRKQAVSALMFGTAALVSKPGQTLAPLIGTWLLSVQTGNQCSVLSITMGTCFQYS